MHLHNKKWEISHRLSTRKLCHPMPLNTRIISAALYSRLLDTATLCSLRSQRRFSRGQGVPIIGRAYIHSVLNP
jgi:hypothetical protein